MRRLAFLPLLVLGLALMLPAPVVGQDADGGDEEAAKIAKNSGLWTFGFGHEHPAWISLNRDLGNELRDGKVPGEFSGSHKLLRTENFWYLYYWIKNETEEDQRFFINITATSDISGKTKARKHARRYHDIYDPAVFKKAEAILRYRGKVKEGEKLYHQKDLTLPSAGSDLSASFPRKLAMPKIAAGQTMKCVALFRKFDGEMDGLTIRFEGLSNDLQIEAPEDHTRTVTTKVLELAYKRPGDEFFAVGDAMTFLWRKWMEVKTTIKTDLKSP